MKSFNVYFLLLEDFILMSPASISSSSTKESPDNRYNATHAIDGDFRSLYFAPVFDSSITDKQSFWVKVRFSGVYYVRYVKYKVKENSFFYIRIGAIGAYTAVWKNYFAGWFYGRDNEKLMTLATAEMVKGEWAFLLHDYPTKEFRLYEIQIWGIRAE